MSRGGTHMCLRAHLHMKSLESGQRSFSMQDLMTSRYGCTPQQWVPMETPKEPGGNSHTLVDVRTMSRVETRGLCLISVLLVSICPRRRSRAVLAMFLAVVNLTL